MPAAQAGISYLVFGFFVNLSSHPTFNVNPAREQQPLESPPFYESVFADGALWSSFFRNGDGYLLRFPGLADFSVSSDGRSVSAWPLAGVTTQTVEHLYLNQALPLALSRQYELVLHAGAVEIEDSAVAFIGFSGRGKSTLVASFATSGFRFLADDGLQLKVAAGGYLALPSHASIRLWDDSRLALIPETAQAAPPVDYTPKARLLASDETAHCDLPRPLRCMYFLGEDNANSVAIEAVSGRDAMIEMVRHSFLLDVEEKIMLKHHFSQLTNLVARPMFYRLDFPRNYDMLPAVREAVLAHSANAN